MPIGETPPNVLCVSAFMRVCKFLSAKNEAHRLWMLMLVELDIEVVSVIAVTKT